MLSSAQKVTATLVFAASIASVSSVALAAPITNGAALRNATPSTVEAVRWHGGWWGAPAAAFVAGGIVGGALAAPYYYGYGPYYPGPYYPGPYAAAPAYYGGGEAYCSQRFKSYDPSTGTYLGYDGHRHPCP